MHHGSGYADFSHSDHSYKGGVVSVGMKYLYCTPWSAYRCPHHPVICTLRSAYRCPHHPVICTLRSAYKCPHHPVICTLRSTYRCPHHPVICTLRSAYRCPHHPVICTPRYVLWCLHSTACILTPSHKHWGLQNQCQYQRCCFPVSRCKNSISFVYCQVWYESDGFLYFVQESSWFWFALYSQ